VPANNHDDMPRQGEAIKPRRRLTTGVESKMPRSIADLRLWVHEHLHLRVPEEVDLLIACEAVIARQRDRVQDAKLKGLHTQSKNFVEKVTKLQRQLSTTGNKEMAESFEDVLSALTDQSHRDPKTTLLHFPWFMERLEWFVGFERRHQWCAVGLVDIANFKWYNDTVGHLVGDRIIERVAHILAEQIRSDDLLSGECQTLDRPGEQDLHARFGGDEFSFLIPDVFSFNEAYGIAQRFKTVVERYDWAAEHEALAERPVVVDVGMVCVQLGPLPERQSHAGHFAAELVQRADQLMYAAKNEHASTVRALALRVHNGELIELFGWESAARAEDPAEPNPHSASAVHLPSRFHWNPVEDIKPRPTPA
jgi:GGDEF domain-containing protein